MKANGILAKALTSIPADTKIFTHKLADIADRVDALLAQKGWSQKDLAREMGKQESEVSKWLTTPHNLTLKSIAKLEAALGAEIMQVAGSAQAGKQYVYLTVHAQPNMALHQASDSLMTTSLSVKAVEPVLVDQAGSDSDMSEVTAA